MSSSVILCLLCNSACYAYPCLLINYKQEVPWTTSVCFIKELFSLRFHTSQFFLNRCHLLNSRIALEEQYMLLLSNKWSSLQGLAPFAATCSEIEQTRTNSFHGNSLLNCISSSMVCKIFFCSKSPSIQKKSRQGKNK